MTFATQLFQSENLVLEQFQILFKIDRDQANQLSGKNWVDHDCASVTRFFHWS